MNIPMMKPSTIFCSLHSGAESAGSNPIGLADMMLVACDWSRRVPVTQPVTPSPRDVTDDVTRPRPNRARSNRHGPGQI